MSCPCCQLHVHDARSFKDGLAPTEDLVALAAKKRMPGIAITNHGNAYSAPALFAACKKHGIKGVIGMEAYEAVPHAFDPEDPDQAAIWKAKFDPNVPRLFHLTLWVQNLKGWLNLCALHTASFHASHKPKNQPMIDRALLERHHEGLIFGLGCMASRTSRALATNGVDAGYEAAKFYVDLAGPENVYMELMANTTEQMGLLRPQRQLAKKLGVECIADNDVHYLHREDGVLNGPHHVLVQSRFFGKAREAGETGDRSDDSFGDWYGSDGFYLKDGDEMLATGGFERAEVARTVEVLERIDFDFDQLPKPKPPQPAIPQPGDNPDFDAWLSASAA